MSQLTLLRLGQGPRDPTGSSQGIAIGIRSNRLSRRPSSLRPGPELLQENFTAEKLTDTLKQLLNPNDPVRTKMTAGFETIHQQIGTQPIDTILPNKLLALIN